MQVESSQLVAGNLTYLLLVISMMMTRMFWLRIFAIAGGSMGAAYSWFWLNDPIGTVWEIIFVSVNVVQISIVSYRNAMLKFSSEEREFYRLMVPSLEPHQVRRLLRIAEWQRAEPGAPLIEQGKLATHLIFIKSGEVEILHEGVKVGSCGRGSLLGEFSVANDEPATATAVAVETVQYLAIEKNALRKIRRSDPTISQAMENCTRESLRTKLVRMNVAAAEGLIEVRG